MLVRNLETGVIKDLSVATCESLIKKGTHEKVSKPKKAKK